MSAKLSGIKTVAFDADDTLWDNEPLFREAERVWAEALSDHGTLEELSGKLYQVEEKNMYDLGYGAKAFAISLIETSLMVAGERLNNRQVQTALQQVLRIIHNPATPYEGVCDTLESLKNDGRYRLALLTKGDLLDQQRKLERSGLWKYFDRVEIVSAKGEEQYLSLCEAEGIRTEALAMVGNSFKSDIAPVLRIGGSGFHVPSQTLWVHEATEEFNHPKLVKVSKISEILDYLI